MATESSPLPGQRASTVDSSQLPTFEPDASGSRRAGRSWREPWWRPAISFPLYALAALLLLAGLGVGSTIVAFQGLEVGAIGLLAGDAWGVRRHAPLLNASNRAVAIGGWALLVLAAGALALALPLS